MSLSKLRLRAVECALVPSVVVAALGILQPGIDPVFLALISNAHGLEPALHGWIVSATQAGLALGSLMSLVAGSRLPAFAFAGTMAAAVLMALLTSVTGDFAALLILRTLHGVAMGMLYTQAMAHAARMRTNGAFAFAFLLQLALSTIVAAILPVLAQTMGAPMALAVLALAPLVCLIVVLFAPGALGLEGGQGAVGSSGGRADVLPVSGSAGKADGALPVQLGLAALALFCFVCATMMVWSLTGAMAMAAGFDDKTIGMAVSIGSLVGAVTALAVFRERVIVSPRLTALLCGLCLMAPVAGARSGDAVQFVAALILFNIGSTAIVIRCSGFAAAEALRRSQTAMRFVYCVQSTAMIAGPSIGSLAAMTGREDGPLMPAAVAVVLGCFALAAWHWRERGRFGRLMPERAAKPLPQIA